MKHQLPISLFLDVLMQLSNLESLYDCKGLYTRAMCGQYSKAGQTPKDAEVKGTAERKQELGKTQVLSRAYLPFPSPSHEAEIQGYSIKQPSDTQEAGHGASTTGVKGP